jgi:hypothetical protein
MVDLKTIPDPPPEKGTGGNDRVHVKQLVAQTFLTKVARNYSHNASTIEC